MVNVLQRTEADLRVILSICGCVGPPMAGRLLKVSSLATAVFASSGFYLYNRQLELSDLSVIRFGRAAAT
ncbi:hypothetical protein ILYODFUR_016307, partial [Ilyodon furcidens]